MNDKHQAAVTVESGKLAQSAPDAFGVRSFKGIPYAAPPVGALRFAPPLPCANWVGLRPSDNFGYNALQKVIFPDIDPFVDGVSEDCLYLNVWTGAVAGAVTGSDTGSDTGADLAASKKLPVLVWIHGGGFVVGSGSEPRYNGAKLAERGVVIVTVNHRLNALGYLAHPALTKEAGSSGNYAMLDLIAALQWVKRNIAAFGGDPQRVTIAGESAGAMACSAMMCSPLAKGLFCGVIGQSGGLLATPAEPLMTLAEAETLGVAFAQSVGATSVAGLRNVASAHILDAAPGLGFRPIIDGHVLTEHPFDTFAKGEQHDVPMMAGWNKDEGFNFDTKNWGDGQKGVSHWLNLHFGAKSKDALTHYPIAPIQRAAQSARDLGGDLIINHGTWAWIEAQRSHGKSPLFRYCFDHSPKTQPGFFPPDARNTGAFHSCEIPYVFDVPEALGWQISGADRAIAKLTANYWANFIKTGNPNGDGLCNWISYREDTRPCLRIAMSCDTEADIDGDRHRFLKLALDKRA